MQQSICGDQRSGTCVGANISEAQRGQSRADFAAKMNIARKDANETEYWLRLLHRTDYPTTSCCHIDGNHEDCEIIPHSEFCIPHFTEVNL